MGIWNLKGVAAAATLLTASHFAWADYPDKPVVLVVPFAAGGPSDKIARDLADALRKPLAQTVIVDNTAGAGGTIGSARVARAAPDGYTLLVHHIGMATAPALYKKLPYKVPEDFEPLGLINEAPSTLVGRPSLPVNQFAELRKWIAANEGKVNIANAGVGSASHLCGLLLQASLASKMIPVPYKGTAPAMTDLMGGQVDLMCEQATNAVPQIEAKKIKLFGVTSKQKLPLPALAQAPTLAEAGLAGFEMTVWHGLYAPRGTPAAVLAKLNTALRSALKDPELIKRQEALGVRVVTDARLEPVEHRKFVEAELQRWSKVIRDAGESAD
ncbi:tripartite tricarboxylate transporter substrate-binding protein [Curvibacter sp. RS43]|uniref:Tripartite tricarboxylate transporter substrate-binding protein n=1 Tax=Curvibacter microcysteis TaxID=3026419 RepID=A0ABT5MFQ7_9BURK|nr:MULTISPECIES: tripartite tricarboxylate transporter substrate-binding protein [unclassified Curvibacter]MDD0808936.1 tripartite tricarboxylate transporter substrate-binding protein [Curvibacter sp. RS43]MDD0814005.1 tripartite tricarboxylate transporter substrate-binding protein [Curvibacter sp. HBC28]